MNAQQRADRALNRLAKWRTLLTGWQLGTRPKGDPECDAVRDHREATLLLRVETAALMGLLVSKGVFTADEADEALAREADFLSESYARRFPGVTADLDGLHFDLAKVHAAGWMKGWKP